MEPTAYGDAGIQDKEDPLSQKIQQEAEQVKITAEKRKALVALHDLYEVEIAKLGETELALLAERLSGLRKTSLRDVSNRFDPALKNYQVECEKWLARLEKCRYSKGCQYRSTVLPAGRTDLPSALAQTGRKRLGTKGRASKTRLAMAI